MLDQQNYLEWPSSLPALGYHQNLWPPRSLLGSDNSLLQPCYSCGSKDNTSLLTMQREQTALIKAAPQLLSERVLPTHDWQPSKQTAAGKGYTEKPQTAREFLSFFSRGSHTTHEEKEKWKRIIHGRMWSDVWHAWHSMHPFLGVRKKAWRHPWGVIDKDTEPWHQHWHTHGNDKREMARYLFLSWSNHYLNYGKCTFVSPYAILHSFLGAKISPERNLAY